MKKSLMEILCCPVCKGELELRVVEEDDGDIVTGSLRCSACGVDYPITDGIPDLLPGTGRDGEE
ncbi:MAG: methytransferase partner Trm112 [Methanoculleaceae archaeon]